jgi:hypothetical protein
MPRTALPVRKPKLYVMPFLQPVIDEVRSQAGAMEPIVVGSTLLIRGRQLRGEDTLLRIAGQDVSPDQVTDTQISVGLPSQDLPTDKLQAGIQGVQVVHHLLLDEPATPHRGFESNVAAFVLQPTIEKLANGEHDIQASSTDVTVKVKPKIRQGQQVVLLLNEIAEKAPKAYTFPAGPLQADSDSITIPFSGVKAADYFVRVQVDGAESPLELKEIPDPNDPTRKKYIRCPQVTIP